MAAVEHVDGKNSCVYHRDGDPCPECIRIKREQPHMAHARIPAPSTPAKRPYRKRGDLSPNTPRARAEARVTLQQITEEFKGKTAFTLIDGIEVRHPSDDEVDERFKHARPRGRMVAACLKAAQASPNGNAEFKVPKGIKANSFRATLQKHFTEKGGHYRFNVDQKAGTVVVVKGN